jgi:hypothetical protein
VTCGGSTGSRRRHEHDEIGELADRDVAGLMIKVISLNGSAVLTGQSRIAP